ncbi:MAG TPA: aldo/keto reductase [Actinophytocola sp.]|uniref:aldo/keto reductase n=1 Tax=Actinophytocola sp. TaxID=1872138 RepID=UPI002DB8B304|nr:aldo/keto reductase [Actinophytocola sp.]HEU5475180.1 aldo/keto reductase [Actinophytocola sp.]
MLDRRVIAGLDAEVSAIGAGCWTIGGPAVNNGVPIGWDNVDPDLAYAGLVRAYELGITLYDTADVYGLGRSERLLGRLVREVRRDYLVISSKVGYFSGTASHPYHPTQMRNQLATTLDNLGTDHLDMYSFHSLDFGDNDRYLPGAIEFMCGLRDQGVIRAIGIRAPHTFAEQWATGSRREAAEIRRWLHLFGQIQPDVVTARYNLISPLYAADETDIFRFARGRGVGVLIKQALGEGLLLQSQQSDPPPQFSTSDHRSIDQAFSAARRHNLCARLAPIRARFGDNPTALARLCLRYALQHAPDAAVLVGFRDAAQIHTNATCLGDPLTDDEITEIRALLHSNTPAS